MKLIVRARGSWKKVTFKIPDELWKRIEETCRVHNFMVDDALRLILLSEYICDEGHGKEDVEAAEKRIEALRRELYELEGKWSPLKFKVYYSALDNQNLAIQLSGMMAENRRLRKMLGLPERDFSKVEGLIRYYMSSAFGVKNAGDKE